MRKLLILGAGLVSRPIVRYYLDRDGYDLTLATLEIEDARALVRDHPRGRAVELDVNHTERLEPLVASADLVVSLLPYTFHPQVARCAIKHGTQMITTSYVSPEMRSLDGEARRRGVMILNEVGLDPGIDHMSAMRAIDRIRSDGGMVTAFSSCAGGLPSPEAADNPWKYKFSWSPRGALLAGCYPARFLEEGTVHHVPGEDLFSHCWPYEIEGVGRFEMYPNRDSLRYADLYDVHQVRTMLRGTIRYPGWCRAMKALVDLGLLDVEERRWPAGTTYAEMVDGLLPAGRGPLRKRLANRLRIPEDDDILHRIEWTGLLSDRPLPQTNASPLDLLAAALQERMAYRNGEQDMILMRHGVEARWSDGRGRRFVSLLVCRGEPGGDSATSRTVTLPAAVAGRLMLAEGLRLPGVHIPVSPALYEPILAELEQLGIRFEEWSEPLEDELPG